jgi:hypothetical protein
MAQRAIGRGRFFQAPLQGARAHAPERFQRRRAIGQFAWRRAQELAGHSPTAINPLCAA